MVDVNFTKVKNRIGGEYIIVYESGCIKTPLLILDKNSIESLIKEWNKK